MTTPTEPTVAAPDDFTAAKEIFEKLKELSKERQQRVLRWVAEGLGISLTPSSHSRPTAAQPTPPTAAPLSPQPSALLPYEPPGERTHVDIKTFVASKKPNSDMQFAATVAYWYRFEAPPAQQRDTIDGAALQEAARLSGRRRPANPRVTLNNAKTQGYLDGAGQGVFAINSVGENLVAMTLGSETGAPAPAPTQKRKRKKKASKTNTKAGTSKSKKK